MNSKSDSGKRKPYRQPEIKSQKLELGVYGQYGGGDDATTPETRTPGDHRNLGGI